jgi:hypothetical protein
MPGADRSGRAGWTSGALGALGGALLFALLLALAWLWLARPPGERVAAEPDPAVAPPVEHVPAPAPRQGAQGVGATHQRVAAMLRERRPPLRPAAGPLRLRVERLELRDPRGRVMVAAESAVGLLQTGVDADILLRSLTVRRPRVTLRRDAVGQDYNLLEWLERWQEGAEPPVRRTRPLLLVRNLVVTGGHLEIHEPNDLYLFRGIEARLPRVALQPPDGLGPDVVVAAASATFVRPATDLVLAVAAENARVRIPDETRFEIERLRLGDTRLTAVAGVWDAAGPGLGLYVTGRAAEVRLADLRAFAPDLPDEGSAAFDFELASLPDDRFALRLEGLDARVEGSVIAGRVAVIVGGAEPELEFIDLRLDPLRLALVEPFTGPLPYAGTLTGRVTGDAAAVNFDVVARLTAPGYVTTPFTTRLEGSAALTAAGVRIRSLAAQLEQVPLAALRPLAPGLPLAGLVTGRVALTGPPGEVPLAVDVRLDLAEGIVVARGTLDLTGAVPAYDLTGQLVGVRLQEVLEPAVPPVFLTAAFTLRGAGTDPATARAAFDVAGAFTGWRAAPDDSLVVRGLLAGGVLELERLSLTLATLALDAAGRWAVFTDGGGAVRYALAVDGMTPFAPYLPFTREAVAAGYLHATGSLAGTLAAPRVEGEVRGRELRYGGWSSRLLEARYVFVPGEPLPFLHLDLDARDGVAPTIGAFRTLAADVRMAPPGLLATVRVDRPLDGPLEVVAEGIGPIAGRPEILLQRFHFQAGEERWVLADPATIRWGGAEGIVAVQGLRIQEVDGPGVLALDGPLPPTAVLPLRIEIAALPVDRFTDLLPEPFRLGGQLWGTAVAYGPADDPRVQMQIHLRDALVGDVPFMDLRGELSYADGVFLLDADGAMPDVPRPLQVRARVPVLLSLAPPGAALIDDGALDVRIEGDAIPLQALFALSPDVRDVTGWASGSIVLTGTPAAPVTRGVLRIDDGAVTLIALDRRYTEISGHVLLQEELIRIEYLRARSDGWATLAGTVRLEQLTRPVLSLEVELDRFRPLGAGAVRAAAATGRVTLTGDLAAPVLRGSITMDDGYVRIPDLGREDLLDLDSPGVVPDVAIGVPGAPRPPEEGLLDVLVIDNLRLRAGPDLWFVADDVRAQLSGDLTIHRQGDLFQIFGDLAGTRGTFTLTAGPIVRRFDLLSAQIRFLGTSPPNPALDIVATRRVMTPGGDVEVEVRVGGTADRPTLALATEFGETIPEGELLSFLLFGQPTFALGTGPLPAGEVLEGLFLGGIADLASLQLEQVVLEDLGLPFDYFRIRPGTVGVAGLGAPTLEFGMEIAQDVFLTVDAGVAALFGGTAVAPTQWAVALEWRIDRQWTLELAVQPVHRGRYLGILPAVIPIATTGQQAVVNIRRRWTY